MKKKSANSYGHSPPIFQIYEIISNRNFLIRIFSWKAGVLLLTLCTCNNSLHGQGIIRGRVSSAKDHLPLSYASIGIKNKPAGCIADSSGQFELRLPFQVTNADTLMISAIGYKTIKKSLDEANVVHTYFLEPRVQELSEVIIRPPQKKLDLGKIPRRGPSFSMGWGNEGQGGEAGNVFKIPFSSYKIEKVQVKISTTYDTCWFRLHIRNFRDGMPSEELLKEDLIVVSTVKEDAVEFDLTENPQYFTSTEIFVGFELMKFSSGNKAAKRKNNYMVYMGNEPAKFRSFHKWFSFSAWEWGKGHSFSVKLTVSQ